MYKNIIFSVIVDVKNRSGKSYTADNIVKRQVQACKDYNLIPCIFPIKVLKDKKIKVKFKDWNLYNTITEEKIIPENICGKDKEEASVWELRQIGIRCLLRYLQSKHCKVTFYHDVVEVDPQVWFIDSAGNVSWLLIRVVCPNCDDSLNSDKLKDLIKKGSMNNGYMAEVSIVAPNGGNVLRGGTFETSILNIKQIYSAKDVQTKVLDEISNEEVSDLIKYSVSRKPVYENNKTSIFEIYNNPSLLLKIGVDNLDKINDLPKNLVVVPIKYENGIKENKNLGLPLYYICRKTSVYAKKGYAEPNKVVSMGSDNFLILRRISGNNIAYMYRHNFLKMLVDYKKQLDTILEIKSKYGIGTVIKLFDFLKKNVSNIKFNQLANGSKKYNISDAKGLYDTYVAFRIGYLGTLRMLSGFSQSAFDKAVNNILSVKDFAFDFSHPNNTFIDLGKQEFNFIDFIFEKKEIKKLEKKNRIEQFRDTIFGINHFLELQPSELLFYPDDVQFYEKCYQNITNKINISLPK